MNEKYTDENLIMPKGVTVTSICDPIRKTKEIDEHLEIELRKKKKPNEKELQQIARMYKEEMDFVRKCF